MVGDKTRQDNLTELEASLAPAEAEVGAMAKADQNHLIYMCFQMITKDKRYKTEMNIY